MMNVKTKFVLFFAFILLVSCGESKKITNNGKAEDNMLSSQEKKDGWILLFDGKSLENFHSFGKDKPGESWVVENGMVRLDSKKGINGHYHANDGGDLTTNDEYENFEFSVDWKINDCGNSGIIYLVKEIPEYDRSFKTGPEMQILDNTCHPDAKITTHRAGDLYDMIESKEETAKTAGEWNRSVVKIKDSHVEHWQNGVKVVEFKMADDNWKAMVANSKFKTMPGFGIFNKGKISLQDHGDPVAFKNIKIRKL